MQAILEAPIDVYSLWITYLVGFIVTKFAPESLLKQRQGKRNKERVEV